MKDMLFSFEGRISRKPYWMWILFIFVGSFVTIFIDGMMTSATTAEQSLPMFYIIFSLVTIWPSLAIQAKRWHDRDKSAWWILMNFVPVIGFIWVIVENGFLVGSDGDNRFGSNPLQ